MEAVIRGIGILGVLLVVIGLWMEFRPPRVKAVSPLPNGFTQPVLAMELAKTVADVEQIVGQQGNSVDQLKALRCNTKRDFALILTYMSLFLAMSMVLAQREFAWAPWLAVAAGGCALAAAVADVIENLRILRVLDLPLTSMSDSMVYGIRQVSLLRWGLIFATMLLLAPTFAFRTGGISVLGLIIGASFAVSAAIGFLSLQRCNPLIELALTACTPGFLLLIVCSLRWPHLLR